MVILWFKKNNFALIILLSFFVRQNLKTEKQILLEFETVSLMTLTMSVESPDSGKYVVYTVTSDESSTDLEDGGHVNFKDTEMDSLNSKPSPSRRPLRSFSSDSSKWSAYWSTREKCCCLWNVAFVLATSVLIFVVVYITKNGANNGSPDANYTWNPSGTYFVSTMTPVGPESDISKVCWGFSRGHSNCALWIVIRKIGAV